MKKETEKEFQKNISYMHGLKRIIPFFSIFLVIIWIISAVISSKDVGISSSLGLIIYLVIVIVLFLFGGWILYKMQIWVMKKNIETLERAHEDLKKGRKPSRLKRIASIIFLILVFPIGGSFFLYLGIKQNNYKVTLFGAGLWACIIYTIFIGLKNYYSKLFRSYHCITCHITCHKAKQSVL